jgi:GT2 family glycosyltransferase
MDYTIDTFDWKFYIGQYQDLRDAGILTKEKAWLHWTKYGKNENRRHRKIFIIDEKKNGKILVALPTYNRSEKFKDIILQLSNQTIQDYLLFIIDDGSDIHHKEIIEKTVKNNSKIKLIRNEKNLHIAKSLNKAIEYFLENEFSYFTWISDDNIYHSKFLETLRYNTNDFCYTNYTLKNEMENTEIINTRNYKDINDLLENFNGCASFMWSKNAIKNIGFYTENINGCEDYDYLIRTFTTVKNKNHINENLMTYIRHKDALFTKDKNNILSLKKKLNKLYESLQNEKKLIYYSRTNYEKLFQRPHQIMRFFDKNYCKIFIGEIDKIKYEKKYNLIIIPYSMKDIIKNNITNESVIYFTDPTLYNEIKTLCCNKWFDLIDAPIDEFEIWKHNLKNCVNKSDYITYSHPYLITFLNEIDNSRDYKYISNACDYDHFSKSKTRIGNKPTDFPETEKPILGYYGAFSTWLDYDIIRKYADDDKYHIVMIGGISDSPLYNIKFEHQNITWLEHKPYNKLPNYLSWFDKCLIPFKDCELTKYVNPCKLWEYMASEKEIIKHNVNICANKIITYKDVCNKVMLDIKSLKNLYYEIKDEMNYDYNLKYLSNINNNFKQQINTERKPTIIVFSMIDYYFRIQRNQHFARLLGEEGFQVFYLKTKIAKEKNIVEKIGKNLYEVNLYCNTDKNISVYKTELSKNDILSLKNSIIDLQKEYNFNYYISYICNPFWYQLIKYTPNTGVIFDCLDYTKGFNNHSEIILKNEDEAIKNEYTIFTSPILKEMIGQKETNFTFIRNACDFEYFNKMKIPKKNERKIIGYFGTISDWFDIDLISYIIQEFPNCDFHLIGAVWCQNKNHEKKIKDLDKLINVTLFGEIPYNELHKYVSKFDIGLIPFIINDLIKCTNPVKLYEMLSLGLPVVMVNLPDVLTLEKDHLYYLSKDKFHFKENIEKILYKKEKDVVEQRIKYASENIWSYRVNKVIKVIENLTPFISIVLLCWNNWKLTKRCIDSVIENTNYKYFELIIVNNNSTDETKQELKWYEKYKFITVVNNSENYGFAKGMNIGTLHSSYEYIVLMNNDTVASKNWLYPLVKPLILNNYSCGSSITNNCGNKLKQFIDFQDITDLMIKSEKLQFSKMYNKFEIDRIAFFCPIIRKNLFYKVGMLDERYGRGGWEDDDILEKFKLLTHGAKNFYTYGSFIYHMESASLGSMYFTQNNNKDKFEQKWKKSWIPSKYNMQRLKINVQTNNTIILDYIYRDNTLYSEDKMKGLTITEKNEKNSLTILECNKEKIILKYNNYFFELIKIEWNIHKLYAIINTCLNCY